MNGNKVAGILLFHFLEFGFFFEIFYPSKNLHILQHAEGRVRS